MNYLKERNKRKLTQVDVALYAKISERTYQLIERGVTKTPAPETVKAIEKILSKDIKV